jgi:hypothetical protein
MSRNVFPEKVLNMKINKKTPKNHKGNVPVRSRWEQQVRKYITQEEGRN